MPVLRLRAVAQLQASAAAVALPCVRGDGLGSQGRAVTSW